MVAGQYFEVRSHVADDGQLLSEAEAELIHLVILLLPLEGWDYVPLCHHQGLADAQDRTLGLWYARLTLYQLTELQLQLNL